MTRPASLALETWIFHRHLGPTKMARADAHAAVQRHPTEWSHHPWSGDGDEPPAGGNVYIPSDWSELAEEPRRAIAAQLDRSFADKPMAACDALVAQVYGDRFAVASEPR